MSTSANESLYAAKNVYLLLQVLCELRCCILRIYIYICFTMILQCYQILSAWQSEISSMSIIVHNMGAWAVSWLPCQLTSGKTGIPPTLLLFLPDGLVLRGLRRRAVGALTFGKVLFSEQFFKFPATKRRVGTSVPTSRSPDVRNASSVQRKNREKCK